MHVVANPRIAPHNGVAFRHISRVTFLQHKTALFTFGAIFGIFAIALYLVGSSPHSAYSLYVQNRCATLPIHTVNCVNAETRISADAGTLNIALIALRGIPIIIAMFLGAPLLSREFESGTYHFVWTQGVGRVRWLMTKLILIAGGVAIGSCLLGFIVVWLTAPFNSVGYSSHWQPGQFDLTPINLAAWALFSFMLGVFVGAIWRQTLQAIATSAALIGALIVASFVWMDNWILSIGAMAFQPGANQVRDVIIGSLNTGAIPGGNAVGPPGSWLVRSWIAGPGGSVLSSQTSQSILAQADSVKLTVANENVGQLPWLIAHHYSYWVSFQPATRYWGFQSIESGTLVIASLVLVAATYYLLRQRKLAPAAIIREVFHSSPLRRDRVGLSHKSSANRDRSRLADLRKIPTTGGI